LRKCLAEFVGVFLFVFIGSLSFSVAVAGPIAIAFAHGLTIVILIISLGHISGGHFNPVITLGVLISGYIHPMMALFYFISQFVGGILGAFFLKAVLTDLAYCLIGGGTTNPHIAEETIPQGILLEMILTYLLVQSVLNAAIESDGTNLLAALAIGFSVLVDNLAGGNKSGASMNIARSFGPAVAYSALAAQSNCSLKNAERLKYQFIDPAQVWAAHYIDWVGPFLGAVLAALIYKLLLTTPHKTWYGSYFRHQPTPSGNKPGNYQSIQ